MSTDDASLPEATLNRVFEEAPQLVCTVDATGAVTMARGRNVASLPTCLDDLVVGRKQVVAAWSGRSGAVTVEHEDRVYEVWAEPLDDGALVVVTDLTDVRRVEHRWRALVRDSAQLLAVVGPDGDIQYASPALKRLLGWPSGSTRIAVKDAFAVVHPDDVGPMRTVIKRMLAGQGRRAVFTAGVTAVDGEWRHMEVSVTNLLDDVTVRGLVMNVRDVTEQRQAHAELRKRARQQEVVAVLGHRALMGVDLAVLTTDAVAMVADTVDADLCGLLELDIEEGHLFLRAGIGWDDGVVGEARLPVDAGTAPGYALVGGAPVVIENLAREVRFTGTEMLRRHGVVSSALVAVQGVDRAFGVLTVHTRARRTFGPDDLHFLEAVANVLATAAERLQAEDEIRLQSVHDALTKLPNRTLFLDRLEQALARAVRTGDSVAVLFLDLDRFKVVNDGLGHVAGDRLLVEVAERLRSIVRPGDTVARFGGDEFVVLCDDIGDEDAAIEVAGRVGAALGRPFLLSGREVTAGASVGIALAVGADHESAEALVRDADAAMYRAKERGKGRYEVFDEGIRARAISRLETEHALRRAIGADQLRLLFQPGMALITGKVAAVEALVRWEHPELGLLSPDRFIPIAEETGLIVPLGEWVLEQAAALAARLQWAAVDGGAMTVAVNLSARQLSDAGLVDRIAGLLRDHDLPARAISLEITESVLMEDAEATRRTLGRLKDVGVYLAVDDFGTGYSSLAYLRRFPVDALKVDKSFVDGLGREAEDSAIVRAVVNLAQTLGLDTVAEGVETEVQRDELLALDCTYAQGYLWAPPMQVEELERMLNPSCALGA